MDQAINDALAKLAELQRYLEDVRKYHAMNKPSVRDPLIALAKAKAEEIVALFP